MSITPMNQLNRIVAAPVGTMITRTNSGKSLVFQVVNAGAALLQAPGVYQFLKRTPEGGYESLYVGRTQHLAIRQSEHMSNRMSDWHKALSLGMTHVGYLSVPGDEWARYEIERDIYETYRPRLNNIAPARPDNKLADALRGLTR